MLLAASFWMTSVVAAERPPLACNATTACEFQLYIENDMMSGTDRYYTNGIKFGGGVSADPLIERIFQAPAESVLRSVSKAPGQVEFGLFLGQNMYTPRNIKTSLPQPLDRPWAAWLYVGGVVQNVEKDRLQTVELDLGMIGPAAQGKLLQSEWHKLIGVDQPQG